MAIKKNERPLLSRYNKAMIDFMTDKIEEGITVAQICRDYKADGIPSEKQVYRWKAKYPEFKQALDNAYQTFFYKKLDELHDLMNEPIPENLDKVRLNAELQRRRLKIDTLKFLLAKIAPKMVPDLRDIPAAAVSLQLPSITVVNYSDKEKGKLIEGKTE